LVVALIVEWGELRSIEEATGPGAIDGQEISGSHAAEPKTDQASRGAERPIRGVEVPESPSCSKAERVVILAIRLDLSPNSASGGARDNFHALNGAGGKLGGEHLALLVADGLPIDHKAGLGVVAHRMENSVCVSRNTPVA